MGLTRILFVRNTRGSYSSLSKAADGTGEAEPYIRSPDRLFSASSWSHDEESLVVVSLNVHGASGADVGVISMKQESVWRPLLAETYLETSPTISPEGQWMAYVSDESGRVEVYVRPFPEVESGRRVQVSDGGGGQPQWSEDGRELYYRSRTERAMMAVSVTTEPSLSVGVPEPLFEDPYSYGVGPRNYDVGPDGRFLMIKEETAPRQINIVRNWTEELKARVPSGQ